MILTARIVPLLDGSRGVSGPSDVVVPEAIIHAVDGTTIRRILVGDIIVTHDNETLAYAWDIYVPEAFTVILNTENPDVGTFVSPVFEGKEANPADWSSPYFLRQVLTEEEYQTFVTLSRKIVEHLTSDRVIAIRHETEG